MRLKLETLSSKMVVNHLNFLHGLFGLELEIGQPAPQRLAAGSSQSEPQQPGGW